MIRNLNIIIWQNMEPYACRPTSLSLSLSLSLFRPPSICLRAVCENSESIGF